MSYKGALVGRPTWSLGSNGLFVIADVADEVADLGNEAHLRNRGRGCAWLWKHVADLGDLPFGFQHGGVQLLPKLLAGWVLEGSIVRAGEDSYWTGDALPVPGSAAEYIEVAVSKSALSLVEHPESHVPVCLYGRDRLVSMALASSAVPNCPCCANAVSWSAKNVDVAAMINVRAMDCLPIIHARQGQRDWTPIAPPNKMLDCNAGRRHKRCR